MRHEVHIADIISELGRHSMLPAIVFRTARAQCDTDVQHASTARDLHLPPLQQREMQVTVQEIARRYEMEMEIITTHPQYPSLLKTGVGAHHAGQLLAWRLLLEELMSAGQLRVLVATGTVAAGVDFPARTVVITAHSKRGADGFQNLTASELQQMSGRAGRRGKDTVGFCLSAPAGFCDARTVLKISTKPPEPLRSQYFPGPSTVLNLLRYRDAEDLKYTVQRSLAAFYDRKEAQVHLEEADEILAKLPTDLRSYIIEELSAKKPDNEDESTNQIGLTKDQKKTFKRVRRLRNQAKELEDKQVVLLEVALNGLRELGFLNGSVLSDKGFWAANLCTTYVLELSEIIESGILEKASAEQLVAIISSFCGDEHRTYLDTKNSPISKQEEEKLREIFSKLKKLRMPGVSDNLKPLPFAANTAVTWMHAKDWSEFRSMLILKGVAEGDAARLITQTAEQLNQITRLEQSHPQLAIKAEEAKRKILRPPLTEGITID
jgi:superfamily II RNA helicase